MKRIVLVVFLLVFSFVFGVPSDYVYPNMNSISPRNGQILKNDGTVVNEADVLATGQYNIPLNTQISMGMIDG